MAGGDSGREPGPVRGHQPLPRAGSRCPAERNSRESQQVTQGVVSSKNPVMRAYESETMNNFCISCGSQLTRQSRFCTQCGTPTNGEKAPTAEQDHGNVANNTRTPKRHKLIIGIIMASLGLALVCGILAIPEQDQPSRPAKPGPCQKILTFPGMNQIYRNPEPHKGSCYEWSGQVTQTFSHRDFVVRTSFYAPYSDGRIYVFGDHECIGSPTQQRVLQGDHVTFLGEFMFIGEQEMTGGSTESWPLVKCHLPTPSEP